MAVSERAIIAARHRDIYTFSVRDATLASISQTFQGRRGGGGGSSLNYRREGFANRENTSRLSSRFARMSVSCFIREVHFACVSFATMENSFRLRHFGEKNQLSHFDIFFIYIYIYVLIFKCAATSKMKELIVIIFVETETRKIGGLKNLDSHRII